MMASPDFGSIVAGISRGCWDGSSWTKDQVMGPCGFSYGVDRRLDVLLGVLMRGSVIRE